MKTKSFNRKKIDIYNRKDNNQRKYVSTNENIKNNTNAKINKQVFL